MTQVKMLTQTQIVSPSHRLLQEGTQLSSLITSLLCSRKIDSTFNSKKTTADLFFLFFSVVNQRAYLSERQCINITV